MHIELCLENWHCRELFVSFKHTGWAANIGLEGIPLKKLFQSGKTYTVEQLNSWTAKNGLIKYLISGAKEETRENRISKLNA